MKVEDAFFVVWREDGPGPTVKHSTRAKAAAEAQRLARCNPGQKFVVLESQQAFQMHDLQVTNYATGIPF